MKGTFLDNILEKKRHRVTAAKTSAAAAAIRERAFEVRAVSEDHAFAAALCPPGRINLIAEIKRASPSKGIINDTIDVAAAARAYEAGGARAISVLTEEDYFKGSLDDLLSARRASSLPILRKDFIFDEFQIYEAAEAGADAVLLIVSALSKAQLADLAGVADELGIDVLTEVHDSDELALAQDLGAMLIGINNRSLHTFGVSLDVSRNMAAGKRPGSLMIAESGISTRDEILELMSLGFDGFLVGETLMRTGDPRQILLEWTATETEGAR